MRLINASAWARLAPWSSARGVEVVHPVARRRDPDLLEAPLVEAPRGLDLVGEERLDGRAVLELLDDDASSMSESSTLNVSQIPDSDSEISTAA